MSCWLRRDLPAQRSTTGQPVKLSIPHLESRHPESKIPRQRQTQRIRRARGIAGPTTDATASADHRRGPTATRGIAGPTRGPTDATSTHQRVDRRPARRGESTALDARAAGATAGRSRPRQRLHPVCCRCAAPAVAPAAISTIALDRARRASTGQRARDQQGRQPTGSQRLLAPTADPSRVVSVALLASAGGCHR